MSKHELIDKQIHVLCYASGRRLEGKILDVIPAGERPTDSKMVKFYGEGWQNKQCRTANRPTTSDRVLFIDKFTNHKIVQPIRIPNMHSYIYIEGMK